MSLPFLPTPLGFALLCEIRTEPRGGYALRRLFETTPLEVFSGSPGSIYPALNRLKRESLVVAVGAGRGGRFEITARGEELVDAWLAQPVTLGEISSRLEMCLLRFAFLGFHPDPSLPLAFLVSLVSATEARERQLAAFLEGQGGAGLPTLGRLAIDHGVRTIRATREWAARAITTLGPCVEGEKK